MLGICLHQSFYQYIYDWCSRDAAIHFSSAKINSAVGRAWFPRHSLLPPAPNHTNPVLEGRHKGLLFRGYNDSLSCCSHSLNSSYCSKCNADPESIIFSLGAGVGAMHICPLAYVTFPISVPSSNTHGCTSREVTDSPWRQDCGGQVPCL